ncbi:MAG: hypothetical protein ACKVOK_09265 [Flavobacteriales bacterium]
MKIWGTFNFFFCSAVVVQLTMSDTSFTALSLILWSILSVEILLTAYFILGIHSIYETKESELLDEQEIKKTRTLQLPVTYTVFSTLLACIFVFIGLLLFANNELAYNASWPLMPAVSLNLALFNLLVSFSKKQVEERSDLSTD